MGGSLELLLTKDVAQSYLTQLWNESIFQKAQDSPASILANKISRYFTISLLSIAFITLAYWWPRDVHTAINAFTAVLIVACPCAGALAVPFTLGNAMGILGRWGFFLKNTNAIEGLYRINTVVVDKTGTITAKENSVATYFGEELSEVEKQALLLLTQQSAHPMSQLISQTLQRELGDAKTEKTVLTNFKEFLGKGIEAQVGEWLLQLGSPKFVSAADDAPQGVYLCINGHIKGHFVATNYLRDQAAEVIDYFQHLGDVYLLSGDNDQEAEFLAPMFQSRQNLHFRQSPKDKLQFIKTLQEQGRQVLMIGDGLNDAGALRQSDVGIVVTEDTSNFTPASDGILAANRFGFLPSLVQYARNSVRLVFGAYSLALVYNLVGLSFAVQGALSPVVAAILMPLSSITIVIYGTLASNGLAKKLLK
jgi:Cu+-exporting ATPase